MNNALESAAVAKVLAGLASDRRVDIFRALLPYAETGLTVGAIQQAVGMPASTLSFHLHELIGAGLVRQQRAGRTVLCWPEIETLRALMTKLDRECCSAEAGPSA